MTSVNVTSVTNTVTVVEGDTTVVTVTTAGPQGATGTVAAANSGTAAAPGISFTSDPNTGIYNPSADNLSFSTGGVQRLSIASDGTINVVGNLTEGGNNVVSVGDTGTVTSTMILDGTILNEDINASAAIAGTKISPNFGSQNTTTTGTSTAASFIPTSSTAPTNGVYLSAANTVAISTASTGRLFVDSTGRLLVGTATASGANLLQVNSDALINGVTVGLGPGAVTSNAAIGPSVLNLNTTGGNNAAVGQFALYSNTTGSSNVAVGKDASLSNSVGTSNTGLGSRALFLSTGSRNIGIGYNAGSALTTGDNNTIIGSINGTAGLSDTVIIGAGTTERMRIDSSGRLLVGTSATTGGAVALLQVQGYSGGSTGVGLLELKRGAAVPANGDELGRIDFSSSNSERGAVITTARDGGTWTAGSSYPGRLVFSTTANGAAVPTERMRIDSAGKVYITTTSVGLTVSQGATGAGTNGQIALGDVGPGTPSARIDGYRTSGSFAGELHLYTTVAGGTVTRAVTIDSSQRVGIGITPAAYGENSRLTLNSTGLTNAIYSNFNGTGNDKHILLTNGGSANCYIGTDNTSFTFGQGSAERLRIDPSGRLLVGITTANTSGGVLQLSSGITFPATQVASADPNTLDDYEEGTFTPTMSGAPTTYGQRQGAYTKIGNTVHVRIWINWSGGSSTGSMSITDALPFSPQASSIPVPTIGAYTFGSGITWTGQIAAWVNADTTIQIGQVRSTQASFTAITNSASGVITLAVSYLAA